MDNLAREAVIARASGMSYGKWKAMQNPTKIEPVKEQKKTKCLNCGAEIVNAGNRARKYCDSYCGSQYRERKYREGFYEKQEYEPTGSEAKCRSCGKIFIKAHYRQNFCNRVCYEADKKRYMREYNKKRRGNGVAGKPGAKQCLECGTEFTANSNSRKYCGQECYAVANRRRALERRKRGKTNGKKAKSSLG